MFDLVFHAIGKLSSEFNDQLGSGFNVSNHGVEFNETLDTC